MILFGELVEGNSRHFLQKTLAKKKKKKKKKPPGEKGSVSPLRGGGLSQTPDRHLRLIDAERKRLHKGISGIRAQS